MIVFCFLAYSSSYSEGFKFLNDNVKKRVKENNRKHEIWAKKTQCKQYTAEIMFLQR